MHKLAFPLIYGLRFYRWVFALFDLLQSGAQVESLQVISSLLGYKTKLF